MKFRTQYNSKQFKRVGESTKRPSLTLPDQSLSIKQILDRYASGLPIGGRRVPMYEGDIDDELAGIEFRKLDLADQQRIYEEREAELFELKRQYKEREEKAAADKLAAEQAANAAAQAAASKGA